MTFRATTLAAAAMASLLVAVPAAAQVVVTGSRQDRSVTNAYFRNVGVEHDVINPNPFEFVFVEVELK